MLKQFRTNCLPLLNLQHLPKLAKELTAALFSKDMNGLRLIYKDVTTDLWLNYAGGAAFGGYDNIQAGKTEAHAFVAAMRAH